MRKQVRAAGARNYFMRRKTQAWNTRGRRNGTRSSMKLGRGLLCLAPLQKREQQLCRSAAAVLPRHFVLISLTSNSMEFRTGLVKGPKKLEYGSIKKVEVAASTFLSNSLVSVCFLFHFIQ